jgi:hypothetical protein
MAGLVPAIHVLFLLGALEHIPIRWNRDVLWIL